MDQAHELQEFPQRLQHAAAQIEAISTLESRHASECNALQTQHISETSQLQARHAEEKQTALQGVLRLYARLAAALASGQHDVQQDKDALAAEIARMETPGLTGGDVLELNVGGKQLSTTRETLTQVPGSMLATWFGPLWADKHKLDSQGRVFLNCDPFCFERILSFLRCKLIEHPDRPAAQPVIREDSQAEFETLVEYLGLGELMIISTFTFSKVIAAVLTDSGCVAEAIDRDSVSFAAPAMQPCTVHYIKCNIIFGAAWMFLGVTQLSEPKQDAEVDASSFGWSSSCQYRAGKWTLTSVPGWQTGDELIFKIDLSVGMLSVWSSQKSCIFQVPISSAVHAPFSFHFGAVKGNKVRLSPACMQDRLHFT